VRGWLNPVCVLPVAMFVGACADMTAASYDLDRGTASYDALKAATETCKATGGSIVLRKTYSGQDLSDYRCAIGKAN